MKRLSWNDFGGTDVDRTKAKPRTEIERGAVGNRLVGEYASRRPFVAEHGPDDGVLLGIVTPCDIRDPGRGDNWNTQPFRQDAEPCVVVGMRMGEKHRAKWLPDSVEPSAQAGRGGDGQRRVDRHDPFRPFDQIGVDGERDRLIEAVDSRRALGGEGATGGQRPGKRQSRRAGGECASGHILQHGSLPPEEWAAVTRGLCR